MKSVTTKAKKIDPVFFRNCNNSKKNKPNQTKTKQRGKGKERTEQ